MPIFDYTCSDCKQTFENIEVWSSHKATECKFCGSKNIEKVIGCHQVRMDSDVVLRSLPDPVPPLEELRGKNKPGMEGGFKDKPYADTQLKNYKRQKDKNGNWIWTEKRRQYFHS